MDSAWIAMVMGVLILVASMGKIIMAATFVTDFGTALALSLLFIRPTWWLVPFLLVSAGIIIVMPRLQPWFFPRYGDRVIEPEIRRRAGWPGTMGWNSTRRWSPVTRLRPLSWQRRTGISTSWL